MHPRTNTERLMKKCAKTESFEQLAAIALTELRKFSNGAEIVCGPISTGGRGTVEENLRIFNATIIALRKSGRPIFSQMPYEERIFFFRAQWRAQEPSRVTEYYMPILEEFYRPLMRSGLFKKGWFIPGWESSFGTRWERQEFIDLGIEVCDLTHAWVENLVRTI